MIIEFNKDSIKISGNINETYNICDLDAETIILILKECVLSEPVDLRQSDDDLSPIAKELMKIFSEELAIKEQIN